MMIELEATALKRSSKVQFSQIRGRVVGDYYADLM
jgi:hypothetical protein